MTLSLKANNRIPQALLALICLVFMAAEIANGKFTLSDFEVYYKAALRLMDGITLYRHPEDRHYIFKYSQVSAVFFIPFTIFPFAVAKVVYWIFLTVIIVHGFRLAIDLCEPGLERSDILKYNTVFLIAIPVLAIHFLRELHLGQVNYLLMATYLVMLRYYRKGNEKATAALFAATFFIKPFTLIFLPYFILKKRFRLIAFSAIAIVALGLVPFLFSMSWTHFLSEYTAWFHELKVEMKWKQGLLTYGNLTLFSVIARYTPLGYMIALDNGTVIFQLLIMAVLSIGYLWYFKKGEQTERAAVADFALLIGTIPLLAYTSANAFIFTAPAIILVLTRWKKLTVRVRAAAIMAFVLIGANFAEIIGKKASAAFDRYSLITIGAALLIGVLMAMRKRDQC